MTRKEEITARMAVIQTELSKPDTTYTLRNEFYTLQRELNSINAAEARAVKDAALAAAGKTREGAVARIAAITEEVETLLKEAEELASDFELNFSVDTNGMDQELSYRGANGYYDGWDSSNC